MVRKVEQSHNQTDMRYIRRHPKRDPFPVRRLNFAAALLVVFVLILLVVERSPWPI